MDEIKQALGWWFPKGEQHLPAWMEQTKQQRFGRLQYQLHKYMAALEWAEGRRCAVDVGANVGLWSWNMARDFNAVAAFEPVPLYARCWRRNIESEAATLREVALGEAEGTVDMAAESDAACGQTGVASAGNGNVAKAVPARTLDSFGLTDVDFIKIDCEGYELCVLRGAVKTLERWRPVVIVEQKPGNAQRYGFGERDAVKFLLDMGARLRAEISGDFILSW